MTTWPRIAFIGFVFLVSVIAGYTFVRNEVVDGLMGAKEHCGKIDFDSFSRCSEAEKQIAFYIQFFSPACRIIKFKSKYECRAELVSTIRQIKAEQSGVSLTSPRLAKPVDVHEDDEAVKSDLYCDNFKCR